jgi:hypothetical protein
MLDDAEGCDSAMMDHVFACDHQMPQHSSNSYSYLDMVSRKVEVCFGSWRDQLHWRKI